MSSVVLRDEYGRTSLARACSQCNTPDVLKWLKLRLQDLDTTDYAGNTPLQLAVNGENPIIASRDRRMMSRRYVVRQLLSSGCDTSCQNMDGNTPLIDAVKQGDLEVVHLLLESGLDPKHANHTGMTAIDFVKRDDEDVHKMISVLEDARGRTIGRNPWSNIGSRVTPLHESASRDEDGSIVSQQGVSHDDREPDKILQRVAPPFARPLVPESAYGLPQQHDSPDHSMSSTDQLRSVMGQNERTLSQAHETRARGDLVVPGDQLMEHSEKEKRSHDIEISREDKNEHRIQLSTLKYKSEPFGQKSGSFDDQLLPSSQQPDTASHPGATGFPVPYQEPQGGVRPGWQVRWDGNSHQW